MKNLKSIRGKISLLVFFAVCITAFVTLLITIKGYATAMNTMIENNMTSYISTLSKNMDAGLNTAVNNLANNHFAKMLIDSEEAVNLEGMGLDAPTEKIPPGGVTAEHNTGKLDKNKILEFLLGQNKDFLYQLSFVGRDGIVSCSTNDEYIGADISEDTTFQMIMDGKDFVLGDYYEDESGKTFGLMIAVKDNEAKTQGVLIADGLTAYLAKIISGKNEYTEEMYDGVLTDVKMIGYENIAINLMDSSGIVIADTDKECVGKKNPDYLINALGKEIADPSKDQAGTIILFEEGRTYYAYNYISTGGWYLIAELPNDDVFGAVDRLNFFVYGIVFIVLIAVVVFACMVATSIAKPVKATTKVLQSMAELDFASIDLSSLGRRNDETGAMAESIGTVVQKLSGVVKQMNDSTKTIYDSSVELNGISKSLEDNAKDNLSLAQELAAGMEETTATYENINENVNSLRSNSAVITEKLSENVNSCNNMYEMVQELNRDTNQATKETKDIYVTVKEEVDAALEKAKAVDKINEMTKAIMDIANKTSLLALNASIEAARAGDAGKGFAVVAEQIGELASQSAENVSNISLIIKEVTDSVEQMKKSLETSLTFMDRKVLNDYENFLNTSEKYSNETVAIKDETENIKNMIDDFLLLLEEISEGINETTTTLEVSSMNTATIADKNSEVVNISGETFTMSVDNMVKSEELKKLIEQFKI